MDKKIASLLSICMKAGKIASGEFSCETLLRSGRAKLIILACDASKNTKKKFIQKTFYYKTPIFQYGLKIELSHCIGKNNRAIIAVTDEGFALNFQRALQN